MQTENKLPKKIYDQLKIRERKKFQKKIKTTFDKGQAIIRIPTVLVEELGLEEGVNCLITGKKFSGKAIITCEWSIEK